MSCQLTILTHFQDISLVKRYLFPSMKEETPEPVTDADHADVTEGWDEDWGSWDEDRSEGMDSDPAEEAIENEVADDRRHWWIQDCIVAISPTNDLAAFAFEDRMVLLAQKWDPQEKQSDLETKFTVVWQGSIKQEESEKITAVVCLPLASQKRSTQGAPDWTCVIVGMSSGYVRMYTETGTLLLSQLLHSEPVQKLKCKTYEPPRYLGVAEQHEELVILFKNALVTIDGFSLFQSLRGCRNQVARATAGGEAMLQPPPLAYKKWGLKEQEKIQDLASCGMHTDNPFDHMRMTSQQSSNSPTLRSGPSAASMYVTAGIGPYMGFFYGIEGTTQPILSEVAYAVASKLKSAIMSAASGWLGFGGKPRDEEKHVPKIEPATPLSHRYGLPDKRRQGDTIVLSPNNNYAACTDSFGRVMLVDVNKGIAVRMWKGYRDAQVGWIQVREDEARGSKQQKYSRVAQFLIIYARRRGILEVWTAANGPRVAAFNVSKWCQLICPGYGMMGLNNVTSQGVRTRAFQCALVDPDGVIKTLEVPFHLALSDKNSKRARDLHLLKKLKTVLKESSEESASLENSIKELLLELKIASITQQGIERIVSTKYLSAPFMTNILKVCIKKLSGKAEDTLDIDSRLFLRYCQMQDSLLHTYHKLNKLNSAGSQAGGTEEYVEMLTQVLGLPKCEVKHIIEQLEQSESVDNREEAKRQVRFDVDSTMSVTSFMKSFLCQPHFSTEGESSRTGSLSVDKRLSEEKRLLLAHFFYHHCLLCSSSPGDLSVILQDCSLPPSQLMSLMLLYWLSDDSRSLLSLPSLYHVIKALTALTDKSEVVVDHNTVSPWWQQVRQACSQSQNTRPAYLAAVAARGVAMEILGNQTKAKDPDADTASCNSDKMESSGEWESLTVDIEHWNLLVKQLEDVLALSCLLKMRLDKSQNDCVRTDKPVTVSVTKILEGGRGSIPEVVARYASGGQLSPDDLYPAPPVTEGNDEMQTETGEEATEKTLTPQERLQGQISLLKQRFPHSLENDVLLANCCWEYAVQWNKDPEVVTNFRSALDYLKLVQNAVLRQGVCSMMWHMFVVKKMSAAAHLMEKVGKSPKDRLCRKEVGISENNLAKFVGNACDLLDITMEANCEVNEVPVFNLEPLWSAVKGPTSLVELAIDQKATNYGLVRHHYHLTVCMHAILLFNLKSVKVLSLYDSKGKHAFFQDLHSHPLLPSQNIDSSICLSRRQFFTRVITHAIHTLEAPTNDSISHSTSPSSSSPIKRKTSAASQWPVLVQELAKDFGLDLDLFKRHHVIELYSGGHDKLAEEVLLTVNDHELMGSQLLLIAGQRVAHYLLKCDPPGTVDLLSNISPTLSTWLKSQDSTHLRSTNTSVTDLSALMGHVANYLPEGYSEYNLAMAMVDLVQSLS